MRYNPRLSNRAERQNLARQVRVLRTAGRTWNDIAQELQIGVKTTRKLYEECSRLPPPPGTMDRQTAARCLSLQVADMRTRLYNVVLAMKSNPKTTILAQGNAILSEAKSLLEDEG
jgi:orotate phosphoribosyltransferase-like protein